MSSGSQKSQPELGSHSSPGALKDDCPLRLSGASVVSSTAGAEHPHTAQNPGESSQERDEEVGGGIGILLTGS